MYYLQCIYLHNTWLVWEGQVDLHGSSRFPDPIDESWNKPSGIGFLVTFPSSYECYQPSGFLIQFLMGWRQSMLFQLILDLLICFYYCREFSWSSCNVYTLILHSQNNCIFKTPIRVCSTMFCRETDIVFHWYPLFKLINCWLLFIIFDYFLSWVVKSRDRTGHIIIFKSWVNSTCRCNQEDCWFWLCCSQQGFPYGSPLHQPKILLILSHQEKFPLVDSSPPPNFYPPSTKG